MKEFKLNSKIELISRDKKMTSGSIYDKADGKVYVSVTAGDMKHKILQIGEAVDGILCNRGGIFTFESIISDRISGEFPLYELSNITKLVKGQRRQDVRVLSSISAEYSANKYLTEIDLNGKEIGKIIGSMSKYLKDGVILDLSAGGLRLFTGEDLKLGTNLLMLFTLEEEMIVKGKIVHKEINMLPKRTTYFYSIKFEDIEDKKREKIIRYLFIQMRKNRAK